MAPAPRRAVPFYLQFPDYTGRLALLLLAIAGIIYFAVHLFGGTLGLAEYQRLGRQQQTLKAQISALDRQISQYERKIALVQTRQLDPDMLDELLRTRLGYVKKNDILFFLPAPRLRVPDKQAQ